MLVQELSYPGCRRTFRKLGEAGNISDHHCHLVLGRGRQTSLAPSDPSDQNQYTDVDCMLDRQRNTMTTLGEPWEYPEANDRPEAPTRSPQSLRTACPGSNKSSHGE